MDGLSFLPNLPMPVVFLVGAIVLTLVGWIGWRLFRADRVPPRPSRNRNPIIRPITPDNVIYPLGSEVETIRQINNILSSLESRFGIPPTLLQEPIRIEDKLERIQRRLNTINTATYHAANNEVESVVVSNESTDNPSWSQGPRQYDPAPPGRSFAEEFVELYNRARENKEARNSFWSQFQIVQIGNRNTSEQRMGRTTETDFRKSDVGDFLAIPNADTGTYLVVPQFTLAIDDTSYRYGGVEAAFECDFAPGSSIQHFQVITPAVFAPDRETWILKSVGKLALGDSQS